MFLLLLCSLSIAGAAEPTTLTPDQQTALEVAAQFVRSDRPINIGCATDPIAQQVGIDRGWSPLCSHGTLTEVVNRVYYGGLTNLEIATGGDMSTRELIDGERDRFSNPAEVLDAYRDLKPFVLPIIRTGNPATVAAYRSYLMDALIPDFTLSVLAALLELYRVEAAAYEANLKARVYDPGKGTYFNAKTAAAYDAANLAFGQAALAAGFHDPLALQWRLRREKEGGQPLVTAWRDVFADFAHSL